MNIATHFKGNNADQDLVARTARVTVAEHKLHRQDIAIEMKITAPLLSGLLNGYRVWTPELASQFDGAIESLTKERKK
jgi:20S proteasome alpha/beta subunit